MTILLFFVIPVTLLPIWLVAIFGGIDLIGLLFQELPKTGSLYGVAHSAHLGGLAAGWLFHQYVLSGNPSGNRSSMELPRWFTRSKARPAPAYTVNLDSSPSRPSSGNASSAKAPPAGRDALRVEVDRILDKINLHGFASLTAEEKRVLDEARHHLNAR